MINTHTPKLAYYRSNLRLDELLQSRALQYLVLAFITGGAALLRFYKLGEWSFWIDEVFNINYAKELWGGISITDQPSLILISLLLRNTEINHFTARLVPTLIGILTIPLLYFPIRKMFGSTVALLAVLLIALSPWHLYWSQNSRFYSSLMLFYALAMFYFYFALEEDRPLYFVLSIVFFGLAFLERAVAGYWAMVMGIYIVSLFLLPFGRPAGLSRRNLLALGVPVVLFLVYQVVAVGMLGQEPFYAGFVEAFIGYNHNPVRVFLSIVYDLGLPLFLVAGMSMLYLLWNRNRAGMFLAVNAVIPVVILVAISPFTQSFSRYVFVTLPAWAVLAAIAVAELLNYVSKEGRLLALAVLIILLADSFSQDILYYAYQNGNRPDWAGAFQQVKEQMKPGDQVVTTRIDIGEYYLQQDVHWTQGLDPDDVVAAGQRTWFVIDNRTGFVSPELAEFLAAETRMVGVRDVYIPGKTMMMRVYRYEPEAH